MKYFTVNGQDPLQNIQTETNKLGPAINIMIGVITTYMLIAAIGFPICLTIALLK